MCHDTIQFALKKKKDLPHPFVSRGGLKLEKALNEFGISVVDRIAIDVGASTGGFADCLLQRGVFRVFTVDVNYGQLAWKLRQDPRVAVLERTNVRYLTLPALMAKVPKEGGRATELPDLAVIDLSFISLAKVLGPVYNLLAVPAEVIALIKPQFEARREEVGRGGIIRDEAVRQDVKERVKVAAEDLGFVVKGITDSPITGAEGNIEFLLYLRKEKNDLLAEAKLFKYRR